MIIDIGKAITVLYRLFNISIINDLAGYLIRLTCSKNAQ
jgi:hypothetical protein